MAAKSAFRCGFYEFKIQLHQFPREYPAYAFHIRSDNDFHRDPLGRFQSLKTIHPATREANPVLLL
jgi:hypothetical protein